MAIVMTALVLCNTDDPVDAKQAVFSALNSAAFETASPVIDFAIGYQQPFEVTHDYQDGEFVAKVPGGRLLETANDVALPC